MSKKINIVKKVDNDIFIEEESKTHNFIKRYGKITIFFAIILLITSLYFTLTNMDKLKEYTLNNVGINIIFPDNNVVIIEPPVIKDDDNPNNNKENQEENQTIEEVFNDYLIIPDDVIFKINSIKISNMEITYYSDYSSKIIDENGNIIKVSSVNNYYGISDKGIIEKEAKKRNITITKKEKSNHGTIIYYSDSTAEIIDNDINIVVGDAKKINEYYITSNKLSYIAEQKEYSNFSTTKYTDGTIVIEQDNKKYVVRNKEDVTISDNDYIFNNNNAAVILVDKTKKLNNNFIVDYLSDGELLYMVKKEMFHLEKVIVL